MDPYSQGYYQQGYFPPQGSPHGNAPVSPGVAAPQIQQQPTAAPGTASQNYGQPQPPYQPYAPYPAPYLYSPEQAKAESNANSAKIYGILSFFLIPIVFSIIAITMGSNAKRILVPGTPAYSAAQTGVITGIISLCLYGFLAFLRII